MREAADCLEGAGDPLPQRAEPVRTELRNITRAGCGCLRDRMGGRCLPKLTVTRNGKPGFKVLKEQIQYQDHGARAERWEADGREVLTGSCFRGEGDPGYCRLPDGGCVVSAEFTSASRARGMQRAGHSPTEAWSVSLMVCGHQACRDL